ncbi:hypothetical protein C8J56DRAFT_750522, partial [Mycena floridula]
EIRDQLWGNFDGRREIRLGQWSLASNEASDEDILSQPNAIPFTQEVDAALSPHRQALAVLFHDPDSVSPAEMDRFPALQQMKDRPLNASSDVLNFGGLSLSDCAQVNNWFDWNIPEAPNLRHKWIRGTIPIFHALTLLLAHRFHSVHIDLPDCPPDDQPLEQHQFLLQRSWEIQTDSALSHPMAVDVDCEAIGALEEAMFTDSADAGKARYYQWGLNAGPHQDGWNPY